MDNFDDKNVYGNLNNDSQTMEPTEVIQSEGVKFDANNEENSKKKFRKRIFGKRITSYVIVGVICSMIGGVTSGAAALYLLPKTNLLNNAQLNGSSAENTSSSTPVYYKTTPLAAVPGALSVADIAKKVGPAVVGVSVKTASQADAFGFSDGGQEGVGSGIIISADGYILTNYHVIDGANTITITFNNKKTAPAKVINYDTDLDLAVIKVTDGSKMPAVADLGDSKSMQVGDPVVAIGNPLGLELLGTVTTGVVSAVNRQMQVGNTTQTFLQTDAAINPGNSGGALVNQFGQVIGINSSKMGGNGVEGLGFAIPIDVAKAKISALVKPILKIGIGARDITSDLSSRYNLPVGVYVAQVEQFSPAEKAGIQTGDVIVKFDGKTVKTTNELNSIKGTHKAGDVVSIQVYRNGSNKDLTLKLAE